VKKCKNVYPRLWRVGIVLVFSCLVVGICFLVAGEYLRLREEREKERMEEFEAGIMNG
jgi:NADH:ubiquinone oxidoreductase subunit 3 (subunit A)